MNYSLLFFLSMGLSIFAQFKVKSTFAKYSKVFSSRNFTGRQAAEALMQAFGIGNVRVEKVGGSLTDHYDPSSKILRLSEPVYGSTSISAVGVAAHETGHALQDKESYGPLILRGTLVPAANIGSTLGPYMAMIGMMLGFAHLLTAGIILFSVAVLFYIITLPVEFDASRRAVVMLRKTGVLTEEELRGVKAVLTAAALTYIASALTAVLNLLYFISAAKERR